MPELVCMPTSIYMLQAAAPAPGDMDIAIWTFAIVLMSWLVAKGLGIALGIFKFRE